MRAGVLLMVALLAGSRAEGVVSPGELQRLSAPARGRVGAALLVLGTGQRAELRGGQRFPMQSVYKLPIAMAVLDRVDRGALALDQPVAVRPSDFVHPGQYSPVRDRFPQGTIIPLREALRLAVSESDGTASDVLLRELGGAVVVQQYLAGLGVTGIRVISTERQIGADHTTQYRNWATPDGMVSLLAALDGGRALSASSRLLLRTWLTETPRGRARLPGLLPPGTAVEHKTGTSGTVEGVTAATNDVGLVTLPNGRRLAVAVFVSDAAAAEPVRDRVIAEIARAGFHAWGQER
jgi:beta-lactamase class A